MPKFAANLSWLFTERPFLERFGAAADAGFRAVEYTFPYEHDPEELRRAAQEAGLTLALFNTPGGDWQKGERGRAATDPTRFRADFEQAMLFAEILEPRRIHIMAGLADPAMGASAQTGVFTDSLLHALSAAPERDFVIEPLNTRDNPGYFLTTSEQASGVIAAVDHPHLRLQLDLYHCQIMEGDLAARIRTLLPIVGHIQIAGVPDRCEPDTGEVHYPYLFDLLDDLGYEGFVGCEYRPATTTEAGLGWFQPHRERQ